MTEGERHGSTLARGQELNLRRTHYTAVIVLAGLAAFTTMGSAQPSRETASVDRPAPPLPPRRPDAKGNLPVEAPEVSRPSAEATDPPKTASADHSVCLDRLTRLGVRFEILAAIEENACSVADPLLVSALPDGLEVSPPATMTCPVAEALARWTLDVLSAEADRQLSTAPTKLVVGTSYQCRAQRSGTKPSEHAFANGIDVVGFEFWKRPPLSIAPHADGSWEAAFQSAIRKGACSYFTTVLGPGSDADHADHLHLDLRARNGGYRVCE